MQSRSTSLILLACVLHNVITPILPFFLWKERQCQRKITQLCFCRLGISNKQTSSLLLVQRSCCQPKGLWTSTCIRQSRLLVYSECWRHSVSKKKRAREDLVSLSRGVIGDACIIPYTLYHRQRQTRVGETRSGLTKYDISRWAYDQNRPQMVGVRMGRRPIVHVTSYNMEQVVFQSTNQYVMSCNN